ncbi:uncharacterized protein LOC121862136 [Homarus americanus]|uniref:Uncharacterized protein n=1 Tax=Homarus americanus TaxID=6706 RepID=A0A8J5N320_HOMAM|nr:uncharacterized protein LOC121862136 [Homarus americanus]KAG7172266.1 hypothetical protein Hamer_G009621 [Homarus americanus]
MDTTGHYTPEHSIQTEDSSSTVPDHTTNTAGDDTRRPQEYSAYEELVHEEPKDSSLGLSKQMGFTYKDPETEDLDENVAGTRRTETHTATTMRSSLGPYESYVLKGASSGSSSSSLRSLKNNSLTHLSRENPSENSSVPHPEYLPEETRTLPSDLILCVETPVDASGNESSVDDERDLDSPDHPEITDSAEGDQGSYNGRRTALTLYIQRQNLSKHACCHRSYLTQNGPPCYLCSMSDIPPKYKREKPGWQKTKEKFAGMFQSLATLDFSHRTRDSPSPPDIEGNTVTFTLSNEILTQDVNNSTSDPYVTSSSSSSPEVLSVSAGEEGRSASIDDIPRVHHQARVSHQQSYQNRSYVLSSLGGDLDVVHYSETAPTIPTQHSLSHLDLVPPPYTPPTPGSLISGLSQQQQQQLQQDVRTVSEVNGRSCICPRNLQHNMIYSALLASVTAVAVFGYDQSFVILVCAIIFFTIFCFMPLIFLLENLLRWKTEVLLRNAMGQPTSETLVNPAFSIPIR